MTFELITHRFTRRAREIICRVFPGTRVPMDVSRRAFKFGQFGYGKYVYPRQAMEEAENRFRAWVASYFPGSAIEYFI